jgi:hypothetical protein
MLLVELVHKGLDLGETVKVKIKKRIKDSPVAYYTSVDNLRNLRVVRKFMCRVGRHKFEETDPEDNVMTCRNCSVKKFGL